MTTDDADSWLAARRELERHHYRCQATRRGRPCRRPTRNVTRAPDGSLFVCCLRCAPVERTA
jgi:hypothetical protein